MSEIEKLAARVEALTGPSREVDAEIAAALRLFPPNVGCVWQGEMRPNSPEVGAVECCTRSGTGGPWYQSKAFTRFLDAAMTLVPEGWRVRQVNFSAPCADDRKWHLNLHGGREGEETFVGRGATPALALCAAALRSRIEDTTKEPRI